MPGASCRTMTVYHRGRFVTAAHFARRVRALPTTCHKITLLFSLRV